MEDNDFVSKDTKKKLVLIRPLDALSIDDLKKYKEKLNEEILIIENEIKNKQAAILNADSLFKS